MSNLQNILYLKDFFGHSNPAELITKFGSPLYVYNEEIMRQRCREMKHLVDYEHFTANYSIKANTNLSLLRIAKDEGFYADAMSPGELNALEKAGFSPEQIFFVPNNVGDDELLYAQSRNICTSLDSLDQLERFGRLAAGSKAAIRINPGLGTGHHEKVITAGKMTKFGISANQIKEAQSIASRYQIKLIGLNQHIGSLFMEPGVYLEAARQLFDLAMTFPDLEFIDLGGGFGIPYHKLSGESRLDLNALGQGLLNLIHDFIAQYGRPVKIKIEPGRYIVAECGILLGTVYAKKVNNGVLYAGTDIGFNVLARPMLYDAWHDIVVYRDGQLLLCDQTEPVTVVGNICESGDIIAKERPLPALRQNDILAVLDAGAYGYAMSSNYNSRLRPAEVLIRKNQEAVLIRRRETFEDLTRTCFE
ncbi:MAG: diaminopimelate decarboxylase [Clostridia bacterium]|nr:diaminopimelate decarboxylase [Clostridia bacterium]